MLKNNLMQGCKGVRVLVCLRSFWEYFLHLTMTLCKDAKALVCLRSFSEYFFMPENDLRTLTGHKGARTV